MPKQLQNNLAICPQCGESVDIRETHRCIKDKKSEYHDCGHKRGHEDPECPCCGR